MKQLSGLDTLFLHTETPSQPMHIGGLGIYDQSTVPGGRLRFKEILERVEARLHLSSVFRRRLANVALSLDRPYWADDADFDIEFHIRHIALPEPRDRRQLMIEAARLHARTIDRSRPLWEWWVIEGLDNVDGVPRGSFAVFFKIHHAAVDGISGREMIDVAHDRTPDGSVAGPDEPWNPSPMPGEVGMLARAMRNNAIQPLNVARTMYESLPIAREVMMRGLRSMPLFPGSVPRTSLNRRISAHRVHDSRTFKLDDLRRIKGAVAGATINDVVLAIVGGALRDYLGTRDDLPDRSLVCGCPISIRPPKDQRAAGNQAIFAMVPIGTDVADPLARLAAIHDAISAKKEFTHAVPANVLTDYARYLPGSLTMLATRTYSRAALANRHRPMMNTIVTNVPGWREELYFAGARMVHWDPFGPVWDGLGLIHPVVSYLDEITIAFDAAREVVPDPDTYRECMGRSYDALAAAVPERAAPARARARRARRPAPASRRPASAEGRT
jgi:diacylglycerol O-acyltransferase / wax synthase